MRTNQKMHLSKAQLLFNIYKRLQFTLVEMHSKLSSLPTPSQSITCKNSLCFTQGPFYIPSPTLPWTTNFQHKASVAGLRSLLSLNFTFSSSVVLGLSFLFQEKTVPTGNCFHNLKLFLAAQRVTLLVKLQMVRYLGPRHNTLGG